MSRSVRKVSIDLDDDYYEVLDHGYVRFIDKLGDDRKVVRAARVSFDKGLKGDPADKRLLSYLYKHGHTSPFEMCSITFEIYLPIFVARQIMRHRTYRFNELSGRYTEMPEDFYVPDEIRVQDKVNKQKSVPSSDTAHHVGLSVMHSIMTDSVDAYSRLLNMGVCREQARMVLPLATYTRLWVNADLNNLLKFFSKRDADDAQWETRQYAIAMREITQRHFPWTMEAYNGE
jgi:thymidylate synthase (FAD)